MRVSGLANIPGAPGNLEFFNTQRMQPRLPMTFGESEAEPQVANAFTDWLFGKKSLSDIVAPGVDRTLKGIPDPTRINNSPGIRDTRNKQQQIIDQLRKGQSFVPEENTFLAQAFPGGQNIGNVGGLAYLENPFNPADYRSPARGVQVDPNKLNLEEYRLDDVDYYAPEEPLERLKFLLSPRGPLASTPANFTNKTVS